MPYGAKTATHMECSSVRQAHLHGNLGGIEEAIVGVNALDWFIGEPSMNHTILNISPVGSDPTCSGYIDAHHSCQGNPHRDTPRHWLSHHIFLETKHH